MGRRGRKVLCSAATGAFESLFELSGPPLVHYARKHGWELVVSHQDTACGRPAAWGKLPVLLAALESYELVAWVDADALVVDCARDLADELRPGKHLYLVEHAHPSGVTTANSGVMMLRASRWSRRLLKRAWACEDLIDHVWWENAAIMRLLGYDVGAHSARRGDDPRPLARVRFLDVAWNSIPHWVGSPRPRIKHYAALPLDERRARMLADLRG